MTSFMPWSSAAVMPYPSMKMKMNLMSLQRSRKTLKNHKFPSGNHHRKETSTSPIKILGTENRYIPLYTQIDTLSTEEEFDRMPQPKLDCLDKPLMCGCEVAKEVETTENLNSIVVGSLEAGIRLFLGLGYYNFMPIIDDRTIAQ